MNQLPTPEVYELEFRFMPWGRLITEVLAHITKTTPHNGHILDLMCGPGYLIHKIYEERPDIQLTGVDNDARYITYATKQYAHSTFICADARVWPAEHSYDVVLCTAGLHHVPYDEQEQFIKKIASHIKEKGYGVIADPYIAPYNNEKERKLAATDLGYRYLNAIIENDAPKEIIDAGVAILHNDVMADGEYKTYLARVQRMLEQSFSRVSLHKTWPQTQSEYGDYYFIVSK